MDRQVIEQLEEQNKTLAKARHEYLLKEAERKHYEAVLVREAKGKSHAERLINAQASDEWLKFHQDLAKKETRFEFEKLKFEILDKEFLRLYASFKEDGRMIKRQVG